MKTGICAGFEEGLLDFQTIRLLDFQTLGLVS